MKISKSVWLCRNSGYIYIGNMFYKNDFNLCGMYKNKKCNVDNMKCDYKRYQLKEWNEKTGLLKDIKE
jgi:hypothetical protein